MCSLAHDDLGCIFPYSIFQRVVYTSRFWLFPFYISGKIFTGWEIVLCFYSVSCCFSYAIFPLCLPIFLCRFCYSISLSFQPVLFSCRELLVGISEILNLWLPIVISIISLVYWFYYFRVITLPIHRLYLFLLT